ncbi:MAG: hypothetical protein COC19_05470 [SAR86 cluster bacterium]|uniref:Uncharacterized protein n=1 Tax=SAR86 cluster bacterium TaxID=2030880 RepID=A0A2A4MLG8_9GAMM|nr:MAG: hypothetical protein COC19_05470 [SAR86 cluster bacterium]
MFYSQLRISLRTFRREKFYASVNLLGLAMGFMCCMILGLYLYDEFTYDLHHENHDQIYRISRLLTIEGNLSVSDTVPLDLASMLKRDYPQIQSYTRFSSQLPRQTLLRYEDVNYYWDNIRIADDSVFEMFTHKTVYGDKESALVNPFSIAISESLSKSYFGDTNPIGRSLSSEAYEYLITYVFEDLPENSHLKYDALLSLNLVPRNPESEWLENLLTYDQFTNSYATYISVPRGVNSESLEQLLSDFRARYIDGTSTLDATHIDFVAEPLPMLHYNSIAASGPEYGNWTYVYAMSSVAVFVLFVACINYMNLAIARSLKRIEEVGMRKILGASKGELTVQFLIESVCFSLVALVVSLILIEFIAELIPLNHLLGKNINLSLIWTPGILSALALSSIMLGILTGLYPACAFSSAQPISNVKGGKSPGRSGAVARYFLVFIQFVITISVISSSLLMYKQMEFIDNMYLGFEKRNKLLLKIQGVDSIQRIPTLITELERHQDVLKAAAVYGEPGQIGARQTVLAQNDEGLMEPQNFKRSSIGPGYLETIGIELLQGRDFSYDRVSDKQKAAIVNETAVRQLGWADPIGKELQFVLAR